MECLALLMQNQIAMLKTDLNKSQEKANDAQVQTAQLTEANATIEQYKKDASNWRSVALEQLRVMGEVLGLF